MKIVNSQKKGILFGGEEKNDRGLAMKKMAERLEVEGFDTWRWRVGASRPRRKSTSKKKSQVCLCWTAGGKTDRCVFAGTDLCFYWELTAHRCYSRKRCKRDVTEEGGKKEKKIKPTNLFRHSSPAQYMLLLSHIFFSLPFFLLPHLHLFSFSLLGHSVHFSGYLSLSSSLSFYLSTPLSSVHEVPMRP